MLLDLHHELGAREELETRAAWAGVVRERPVLRAEVTPGLGQAVRPRRSLIFI